MNAESYKGYRRLTEEEFLAENKARCDELRRLMETPLTPEQIAACEERNRQFDALFRDYMQPIREYLENPPPHELKYPLALIEHPEDETDEEAEERRGKIAAEMRARADEEVFCFSSIQHPQGIE